MSEIQPVAIVCSTCGGDPRVSASCKMCGGAGVGVASPDGFLVWTQPVDDFTVALRKVRRSVFTAFHLALFIFGLLTLVALGWHIVTLESVRDVATWDFWTSGHWTVTMFWVGLFVDCFLVFRLSEYSHEEKILPNWKLSVRERNAQESQTPPNHRFEIAPYFSKAAMDVVEAAYGIANDLKRTEIRPEMLFAASLTSASGGLFMARLGMDFDKVKQPLARLLLAAAPAGNPPVTVSKELKRTLALAYAEARIHHRQHVEVIELFLQAFIDSPKLQDLMNQLGFPAEHVVHVAEWIRLQEGLREDHQRFVELAMLKPNTSMNRAMTAQQTPLLDRFSEDLTLAARNGYLAPIVGREETMEALLRAIESGRRSVALVGEAGSGKAALVEELARRMVEEDVPPELFDRRLVSINLAQLVSAGDRSLAVERLLEALREVAVAGNIILVLHGIEALVGGSSGPMDLAEAFATELDKGYFIAIATTTPQSWTNYLERRSLGTKLVRVDVPTLNAEDTLRVLMAKSGLIEYQNTVFFSYAALEKATSLALRYLLDVAAPENALNVIREAAVAARKARGERTFVTAEDVARVIHTKTNIPVEAVTQQETEKLLGMEEHLHGRIIGQEQAVTAVSQAMRRARAELREGKRPIANFLFLGPTGVGKTELAKALAAEYFGDEKSMIRLDMSEYQDTASVYRMIGASGDPRGGFLTEAVRHHPFAIVLLDEVEKAHPDILNLFLQVMDDGRLTDGVGRTVDFTNTVVIMTSNAGTPFIQSEVAKGTPLASIRTALLERELKGTFRPEFLNRFDGIIVFRPLTMDDVTQIAWLLVNQVGKQLENKGMKFVADDAAVEELAKAGFDPLFGARPLRRVIQEQVDNALADILLRKEAGRGDTVVLEAGGKVRVEKAAAV